MKESKSFTGEIDVDVTVEEIMADFLDAVSRVYSNSMMLKGCMALYIHTDFKTNLRKTRDLDFDFFSLEDWEDFCKNSSLIASKHSKLKFNYTVVSRRGFSKNPNGDSIKFKASNGNRVVEFKIDMNIGNNDFSNLNRKITESPINLYSITGILCDKISVLATRKLCRRIKDIIDVYYICSNFNVDFDLVVASIISKYGEEIQRNLNPCFVLNLENYDNLNHAYSVYDLGDVDKDDFIRVYEKVSMFVSPIYEFLADGKLHYTLWDKGKGLWLR